MLKSMTGFGTATLSTDQAEVTAEVKSLNSKFLDANIRMTKAYMDKEIELRNLLTDRLVRGKVSVNLEVKPKRVDGKVNYNAELFELHYNNLKELADNVGADTSDIFRLAIQSPEVLSNDSNDEGTELWEQVIKPQISIAIEKCDQYRQDEGKVLETKLRSYIVSIREQLAKVIELDGDRVMKIKDRIKNNLSEVIGEEKIDQNRYEQELIYYIEKLDISEEKVRLTNHLDYFTEVMNQSESNGKKLGFISQEIGREINTIGSKANDAGIQKHVVVMKEELEKIKEQMLNVL